MRVSTKHSFLVAVILGFILINEGYGFMKGPCKKKRWSKCHSVTFNIVKRSDSPLSGKCQTIHHYLIYLKFFATVIDKLLT